MVQANKRLRLASDERERQKKLLAHCDRDECRGIKRKKYEWNIESTTKNEEMQEIERKSEIKVAKREELGAMQKVQYCLDKDIAKESSERTREKNCFTVREMCHKQLEQFESLSSAQGRQWQVFVMSQHRLQITRHGEYFTRNETEGEKEVGTSESCASMFSAHL